MRNALRQRARSAARWFRPAPNAGSAPRGCAGRVAAGLLNAIGLAELITSTPQAYESLAIELASNSGKLAHIKRKLVDNRLTSPLFDTRLFTRHIEAAYTAMYERHKAGLSPAHLYVPQ